MTPFQLIQITKALTRFSSTILKANKHFTVFAIRFLVERLETCSQQPANEMIIVHISNSQIFKFENGTFPTGLFRTSFFDKQNNFEHEYGMGVRNSICENANFRVYSFRKSSHVKGS